MIPDYISVSQIEMFLRCGEQYRFRYIEGLKIPPTGALVQGSAYHAALATFFRDRLVMSEFSSFHKAAALDSFSDSFDCQAAYDVDWVDEKPGELKDQGIVLTQTYIEEVGWKIEPVTVEERKETTINGINLVTVTDLVTPINIIDHKLKKRAFSEDELAQDLQSITYGMVENLPLEFHVALKTAKPSIKIQRTPRRTEQDLLFFRELLERVRASIQAGNFIPNPVGWHCGPRFCGYWNLCKGKERTQ